MPKKMGKSLGASTQPHFTPFLMGKGSKRLPLCLIWPFWLSWTCLFQRPPQLTMSKALVRSLKATYRSMLCSQHFHFNWYSTKIVSTVLLLVRKLHWLMESVCSAIVGVSWSRSTLARSCQLSRGRWCLCNCSNRICLLYSCRGRQWQHLWGPMVPLYLLTLPAGNEPRSEMTAWKAS